MLARGKERFLWLLVLSLMSVFFESHFLVFI